MSTTLTYELTYEAPLTAVGAPRRLTASRIAD